MNDQLINFLGAVLTTALSGLFAQAIAYLNQKNKADKQQSATKKADTFAGVAIQTVNDVVVALNQTVVDDLKKASADGKLTDEEKRNIFNDASTKVLSILSQECKENLGLLFGDVNGWINVQINNAVSKNKGNMLNSSETFLNSVATGVINTNVCGKKDSIEESKVEMDVLPGADGEKKGDEKTSIYSEHCGTSNEIVNENNNLQGLVASADKIVVPVNNNGGQQGIVDVCNRIDNLSMAVTQLISTISKNANAANIGYAYPGTGIKMAEANISVKNDAAI